MCVCVCGCINKVGEKGTIRGLQKQLRKNENKVLVWEEGRKREKEKERKREKEKERERERK